MTSTSDGSTASWEDCVKRVQKLPALNQRKVAAIIGAVVADAASQPLHWIYNQNKMDTVLAGNADPAFYPESQNPFYTLDTGSQSPYGDQLFVYLKSLSRNKAFIEEDFVREYYDAFRGRDPTAKASEYQKSDQTSQPTKYPIKGPWYTASMRDFITKYDAKQPTGNPSCLDPDTMIGAIPLLAHYAGTAGGLDKYLNAIKVVQTCSDITAASTLAGKILEMFILGIDASSSAESCLQLLSSDLKKLANPVDQELAGILEEVLQADPAMSPANAAAKFGKA